MTQVNTTLPSAEAGAWPKPPEEPPTPLHAAAVVNAAARAAASGTQRDLVAYLQLRRARANAA